MKTENLEGTAVSGESRTYRLGTMLGGGREGSVYRISGSDSSVIKIFEDGYRAHKSDKVRAMIDNPPEDPTHEQGKGRSIVWPEELITDGAGDQFLGYKMPYKALDEVKNALHYAMTDLDWDGSSERERFTTALNLAIMVHAIHEQGHAIGDFNHENILIDDGYITLIDCDGFHISGSTRTYEGDTFLPRYSPPENRGKRLSIVRKADRFGLGVHVFQLLMEGNHPFLAQGPETADGDWGDMIQQNSFPYGSSAADVEPHDRVDPSYTELPTEIRELFRSCFVVGKTNRAARPEPIEWIKMLGDAAGVSIDSSIERETSKPGRETATTGAQPSEPTSGEPVSPADTSYRGRNTQSAPTSSSPISGSNTSATSRSGAPAQTRGSGQRRRFRRSFDRVKSEIKRAMIYIGGMLLIIVGIYLLLAT